MGYWQNNKKRKKRAVDDKLWDVFSVYIRLRDAGPNGLCKCISCGKLFFYDQGDAGHFVSRGKISTKYNEKNCHAQCKECNRFAEGRQYAHGKAIDLKYGDGTADLLESLSKEKKVYSKFEIDTLTLHFKEEAKKIKLQKGL